MLVRCCERGGACWLPCYACEAGEERGHCVFGSVQDWLVVDRSGCCETIHSCLLIAGSVYVLKGLPIGGVLGGLCLSVLLETQDGTRTGLSK